eukprot:SAG31_NODE_1577_length_7836_cov_3.212744_4_plen_68_part_00
MLQDHVEKESKLTAALLVGVSTRGELHKTWSFRPRNGTNCACTVLEQIMSTKMLTTCMPIIRGEASS